MDVQRTVYREDHEQFRQTVRRFIEREWAPHQDEWNKAGQVSRDIWLKAGREGLLCVTLPTECGGGGGDFGHSAVIAEEIARAGVGGVSLGLHSDIVAPYIHRLGSEEQKARWLPAICRGEKILAIAMTEPGGGSDLKAVRTTAIRDGDHYVINGSKTFISNGILSDLDRGGVQDRPGRRRQGCQPDRGRGGSGGIPARAKAGQGRDARPGHRGDVLRRRAGAGHESAGR